MGQNLRLPGWVWVKIYVYQGGYGSKFTFTEVGMGQNLRLPGWVWVKIYVYQGGYGYGYGSLFPFAILGAFLGLPISKNDSTQ